MSLSKRDTRLLLIVLGLLIAIVIYLVPVANLNSETEAVKAEINGLTPRLTELREHRDKSGEYQSGILAAAATFEAESALYPEEVRTEDFIMFAVMLEKDFGFSIESASFSDPWVVSAFTGMKVEESEISRADYTAYGVSMTINCGMSYRQLKSAVDYINNTEYRNLLDSVTVSYNQDTGGLSGTVTITKLFLSDGMYAYVPTPLDTGALGAYNPFGSVVEPAPGPAQ